jgi:thiol:disulfide interchange protein DsbC
MKRLLILFLFVSSLLSAKEVSPKDIEHIKNNFPFIFSRADVQVAKSVDFGNLKLVEISVGAQNYTFFYSKIDNKIIMGEVLSSDGKKLKAPLDKKLIQEGIIYSYGTGKKDIYIVTDPECPYCKRLENALPKDIGDTYTIHTVLMPLSFHQNAPEMSLWVIDGKDAKERHDRLQKVLNGDTTYKNFNPKHKALLQRQLDLSLKAARELKAGGTPSVFDGDFNQIDYRVLLQK